MNKVQDIMTKFFKEAEDTDQEDKNQKQVTRLLNKMYMPLKKLTFNKSIGKDVSKDVALIKDCMSKLEKYNTEDAGYFIPKDFSIWLLGESSFFPVVFKFFMEKLNTRVETYLSKVS